MPHADIFLHFHAAAAYLITTSYVTIADFSVCYVSEQRAAAALFFSLTYAA